MLWRNHHKEGMQCDAHLIQDDDKVIMMVNGGEGEMNMKLFSGITA